MEKVKIIMLEALLDELTGELDYILQALKRANDYENLDSVDFWFNELLTTLDNQKEELKELKKVKIIKKGSK